MRTADGISSRLPRKYDRRAAAVCDSNGIKDENAQKRVFFFVFSCFAYYIRRVGLPFFVGLPLILFAVRFIRSARVSRLAAVSLTLYYVCLPSAPTYLTVISACRSVYTICPTFVSSLSCPTPRAEEQKDLIYDICRVSRNISVDVALRRF